MSTNVRFLSEKSLAVYEITLIEEFAKLHRRDRQKQAISFVILAAIFTFFALLALFGPMSV